MKIQKIALTCLSIVLLAAITTGCKSKTSTTTTTEPDDTTETVTTELTYSISSLYDLTQLLDVEATYINIDGEKESQSIEELPWSISLEGFKGGEVVTLSIAFTRKENTESTKESYTFGSDMAISFLKSSGTIIDSTNSDTMTCSASKVEDALDYYTANGISFSLNTAL